MTVFCLFLPNDFPYEGKLSPKATDEVEAVA